MALAKNNNPFNYGPWLHTQFFKCIWYIKSPLWSPLNFFNSILNSMKHYENSKYIYTYIFKKKKIPLNIVLSAKGRLPKKASCAYGVQPILSPQATSGFLGAPKSPFVMEKTWENHRTTVKIQRKTGNIPIFHVKHIGHHYLSIYIYTSMEAGLPIRRKVSCTQATRIWPTRKVATKNKQ